MRLSLSSRVAPIVRHVLTSYPISPGSFPCTVDPLTTLRTYSLLGGREDLCKVNRTVDFNRHMTRILSVSQLLSCPKVNWLPPCLFLVLRQLLTHGCSCSSPTPQDLESMGLKLHDDPTKQAPLAVSRLCRAIPQASCRALEPDCFLWPSSSVQTMFYHY